ncbi:hypothetical protein TRFO_10208 [Tritrichomonas foetus]|uniref:DH domain-containing protein n=1 Tax=Tritrichomonas foetus TaxID=1144522 RepID=A0A1J4JA17_9EUKA|nr:hypothetical protein TRFO_10208 [Tritrichomonas foetus]|eukprot:OHS96030.1 hypothetical protein TRFO_10208 [Tritrichomonas foetus]
MDDISFSVVQIYYAPKNIKYTINARKCSKMSGEEIIKMTISKFNNQKIDASTKLDYGISINSKNDNFHFIFPVNNTPIGYVKNLIVFPIDVNLEEEFAPFYLSVFPIKNEEIPYNIRFKIPIVSFNNEFLYSMPISLPYPFSVQMLLKKVADVFDNHSIENGDVKLLNSLGSLKKLDEKPSVLTQEISSNRLYALYNVNDKDMKKIKERKLVVNEIFTKEKEYVEFLRDFETKVRPIFESLQNIPACEYNQLLLSCNSLPSLHKIFLDDLMKFPLDFMMPVGTVYSAFAKCLKIYSNFYSNYQRFLDVLKIASNIPENKEILNKTQVSSTIAKIFQTAFKYALTFPRLLKETPKGHPDYDALKKTCGEMIHSLKVIQQKFIEDNNQPYIEKLYRILDVNQNLIQPNRKYISSYIVFHNDQKVILILLTDLILFVRSIDNGQKLGMISSIPLDQIGLFMYGERSLYYPISRTHNALKKFIVFQNSKERNELFENFRHASVNLNYGQLQVSDPNVNIEFIEMLAIKKKLKLRDHSMILMKNALWIFGGRNESDEPQNSLRKVKISNMATSVHAPDQTDITPRYLAKMVGNDSHLYVFGGTQNGVTPLNDFWHFYYSFNKWDQIIPNGDVKPPPSFNYSMNYSKSNHSIVLAGGTDTFNIFVYKINENIWVQLNLDENSIPKTLSGHSTVIIEESLYAIIGGKINSTVFNNNIITFNPFEYLNNPNNHENNEMKLENIDNNEKSEGNQKNSECVHFKSVQTFGLYPYNRFNQVSLVTDDFLIVFGGDLDSENEDENVMFVLSFESKWWSIINNNPRLTQSILSHKNFSYAVDKKTSTIYLHGGLNENDQIIPNFVSFRVIENENGRKLTKIQSKFNFFSDEELNQILVNPETLIDGSWPKEPIIVNPLIEDE